MARKELTVTPRQVIGKKVATLRREGLLPGNIFGHGLESLSVQVSTEELQRTLRASAANEVIDIKVEGERVVRPVVVHHIQRNPLNGHYLHADFYQVQLREKMRTDVPLNFIGKSDAVETYNGVLVTSLEFVHIEALPLDIPGSIEVDVSVLSELESAIHIRDLQLPENIALLNDPDVVIIKVASPRVSEEAEPGTAPTPSQAAESAESASEAGGDSH